MEERIIELYGKADISGLQLHYTYTSTIAVEVLKEIDEHLTLTCEYNVLYRWFEEDKHTILSYLTMEGDCDVC